MARKGKAQEELWFTSFHFNINFFTSSFLWTFFNFLWTNFVWAFLLLFLCRRLFPSKILATVHPFYSLSTVFNSSSHVSVLHWRRSSSEEQESQSEKRWDEGNKGRMPVMRLSSWVPSGLVWAIATLESTNLNQHNFWIPHFSWLEVGETFWSQTPIWTLFTPSNIDFCKFKPADVQIGCKREERALIQRRIIVNCQLTMCSSALLSAN